MTGKRKEGPPGTQARNSKKSKGSHQGHWQTPHQKQKLARLAECGYKLDAGDVGIWVTCQRKMEKKAMVEMATICDIVCEQLYDIPPPNWDEPQKQATAIGTQEQVNPDYIDDDNNDSENDNDDIETSIKQELEEINGSVASHPRSIRERRGPKRETFLIVDLKCESVFFIKTFPPVDPQQLVLSVCQRAMACKEPRKRQVKYVNRLTPVVATAKATEASLVDLSRSVLSKHFKLRDKEGGNEEHSSSPDVGQAKATSGEETAEPHTYAIRTTRRNHNTLTSETTVKKVASQISFPHRVNLVKPDRIILVELFRNIVGMSVVPGPMFNELKKFNLDSIYKDAILSSAGELSNVTSEGGGSGSAEIDP